MKAKKMCMDLLRAESESEVSELINDTPQMQDPSNWSPLDDRETNFNITSNQASDGGKALTELMTNMVDAVLMKAAYRRKIDPKGKDAPENMYKAVDTLIKNLRGGKLTSLDHDDEWLREFSQENLVIGITGAKNKSKGRPAYTFVDNGEGQCAEDFKETFLSLSAGVKKDIPFVQGKYNMGSSGVLRYCGRHWYKLIISKRHDKKKSCWGWTLIRRRPDEGNSLPVAEYFLLPEKKIPEFKIKMLYPFQTEDKQTYEEIALSTGTVVKLYDYQLSSKFLSFKGSREALNENLMETILPFRIFDFRWNPESAKARSVAEKRGKDRARGIDPRPFYGMEFLLRRGSGYDDDDAALGGEKLLVEKNMSSGAY